MNKKDFVKLCFNYNKEPNEELYELWVEQLEDYDPYYLQLAIENVIKTDKYFPTISRILEVLKDLPYEEITTEEKKRRMKQKGISPEWLDKVFEDEEELVEDFVDFQKFMEEFRETKYVKR